MRKYSSLAALVCAGLLALSGCAGEAEPSESTTFSAPAWMAEVVADREEIEQSYKSCLESKGLETHESNIGLTTVSIPENATVEEEELVSELMQECDDQRRPFMFSDATPDAEYDRMLQTHACLISKGFPLKEATSREVWIQDFKADDGSHYIPYLDLADLIRTQEVSSLSSEELADLQRICVASWSGGGISDW